MNPLPLILGVAAAATAVAVFSAAPSKRAPKAKAAPKGAPPVWTLVRGLPLPPKDAAAYTQAIADWKYGKTAQIRNAAGAVLQGYANAVASGFNKRRPLLPPDASPTADGYSRDRLAWLQLSDVTGGNYNGQITDEWGRHYTGVAVDAFGAALQAAGFALPFIPGIGPAAAAALATAIAIGQGKSLKDATLAGARAALPLPARIAFDAAVGVVVQGKPIDQATEDALTGAIPGGKNAFAKGKALAQKLL